MTMEKKYIVYLRVSTARQGTSGLGLEAQEARVKDWIKSNPGEVIATFKEVESGKRNNRPQLMEALKQAKEAGATLLIAALSRLSRSASFIFALRDAGVDFVACDCPDKNILALSMYAGMAQWEREQISERTKAALQSKKQRGFKLGSPNNLIDNMDKAVENSVQARKAKAANNENNRTASHIIKLLRDAKGFTWSEIVRELEEKGYKTSRGSNKWSAVQVQRLYNQK